MLKPSMLYVTVVLLAYWRVDEAEEVELDEDGDGDVGEVEHEAHGAQGFTSFTAEELDDAPTVDHRGSQQGEEAVAQPLRAQACGASGNGGLQQPRQRQAQEDVQSVRS